MVPRQVQLSPLGFVDKKLVALTFDDGPDPRFTPKILDLLAGEERQGDVLCHRQERGRQPSSLKRIYEEGNDLGNHTYSHPDMLENAGGPIELELTGSSAGARTAMGRHSIFFRPPYTSRKFLQQSEAPASSRAPRVWSSTVAALPIPTTGPGRRPSKSSIE